MDKRQLTVEARTSEGESGDAHTHESTRLQLAMEAGELGMWEWDIDTGRMNYSDRAREIYGFPPDVPLTFEMVRDATHPEDLPLTSAQARRSIDPEIRERKPYEYRLVRPDGCVRWVLAFGQAIFAEHNGKACATRYIGTIQDITARKQMELQLRANAEKLGLALAAGDMAVWEIDTKGQVLSSPGLNRILGFSVDASPTLEEIHSRYSPGELERVQEFARQALARGERAFDVEFRYMHPDSSVRWLWVRAKTPDEIGKDQYSALGVVQDITARKERELHFEFMLHELSHRSKNLLAVVQAITHHTVRATSSPAEFEKAMLGRIQALAAAHNLLVQRNWRGATVSDIVKSQVEIFTDTDRERISISGPEVVLKSGEAQELSICIYELMTNALKYGALSNSSGRVSVHWLIDSRADEQPCVKVFWTESGGPPVAQPKRRGFGTTVLHRAANAQTDAPSLEFDAQGVRWSRTWKLHDGFSGARLVRDASRLGAHASSEAAE